VRSLACLDVVAAVIQVHPIMTLRTRHHCPIGPLKPAQERLWRIPAIDLKAQHQLGRRDVSNQFSQYNLGDVGWHRAANRASYYCDEKWHKAEHEVA